MTSCALKRGDLATQHNRRHAFTLLYEHTGDIMSHCVVGIVGYTGSAALATMLCVQPAAVYLFLHSSQRLLVLVLVLMQVCTRG